MKKFKRIRKLKDYRIHREGTEILILGFLVLVSAGFLLWYYLPGLFVLDVVLSAVFVVTYLLMVNFFRSPKRIFPGDVENVVVAPADGKVVVIEKVFEPDHFKDERMQISIFMSPTNVHANWYPIEGKILVSEHQKGNHKGAWLPKSSTENERSLVVIETASKVQIAIRQIAGAMARRIVTYAKPGHQAHRNTHLGFIKLGSRVDMYLPLNTEMFVQVGEHVRGNETIIGRLQNDPTINTNIE